MMALLTFGSFEDFKSAGKSHGPGIFADIPNFTNAQDRRTMAFGNVSIRTVDDSRPVALCQTAYALMQDGK
jgi:hypothetical protein